MNQETEIKYLNFLDCLTKYQHKLCNYTEKQRPQHNKHPESNIKIDKQDIIGLEDARW